MDPSRSSEFRPAGISAENVDLLGVALLDVNSTEPTRADLLARVAMLEGRLVSVQAIEQAKGALMMAYGLSADAAFALLRFHSQHRNVKIRAIAAQLTDLMCQSPSSTEAIARFNQLLDEVAQQLTTPAPTDADSAANPSTPRGQLPSEVARGELPEVMVKAVAVAPPGMTIAGNSPGLPLVHANKAFTEMTGYLMKEVMGRNCRFLQGPDTDPRDVAILREALRHGRDGSVVMQNYRCDGTPFLSEVSVSPILNRVGQITHFVGTQIDVTRNGVSRVRVPSVE